MRILYLGNNRAGLKVLRWLKEQDEQVVGLVIHPPENQRYGREITESAGLSEEQVFDGSNLRERDVLSRIQRLEPDIGVSVSFGHILRQEFLDLFPQGCVNLHPAYLPYNRGAYPNVWSIVEGTPAGATLHYMDASVDTGDVIAQREVAVAPEDTGESLYRKLEDACVELFIETWPALKAGTAARTAQNSGAGCFHRTRDVQSLDAIDMDREYVARDLINILRARTFPPHNGAYFEEDGSRVYLRLELTRQDQVTA